MPRSCCVGDLGLGSFLRQKAGAVAMMTYDHLAYRMHPRSHPQSRACTLLPCRL